ncbi:hypothetical protein [Tsukamurella soli]|uniref:PASTA domain-containing protein n=1 Tax=Tsukamurella soli TaxID=644556 RepID=A0ABP8KFM4_9ACTN
MCIAALSCACGGRDAAGVALPSGFPSAQVPVEGQVRAAERIDVGHPVWRLTVAGGTTVAASRALLAAGFRPVTPDTPLDAGELGAVYRRGDLTVGVSSDGTTVTYVVSPTPGRSG